MATTIEYTKRAADEWRSTDGRLMIIGDRKGYCVYLYEASEPKMIARGLRTLTEAKQRAAAKLNEADGIVPDIMKRDGSQVVMERLDDAVRSLESVLRQIDNARKAYRRGDVEGFVIDMAHCISNVGVEGELAHAIRWAYRAERNPVLDIDEDLA